MRAESDTTARGTDAAPASTRPVRVPAGAASTAGGAAGAAADDGGSKEHHLGGLLDEVPSAVRLQLELVARSTPDADAALPAAISLIVSDRPRTQEAIVAAFRSNDQLREQWRRAWQQLRR